MITNKNRYCMYEISWRDTASNLKTEVRGYRVKTWETASYRHGSQYKY
jgi:hypothetical protein